MSKIQKKTLNLSISLYPANIKSKIAKSLHCKVLHLIILEDINLASGHLFWQTTVASNSGSVTNNPGSNEIVVAINPGLKMS